MGLQKLFEFKHAQLESLHLLVAFGLVLLQARLVLMAHRTQVVDLPLLDLDLALQLGDVLWSLRQSVGLNLDLALQLGDVLGSLRQSVGRAVRRILPHDKRGER